MLHLDAVKLSQRKEHEVLGRVIRRAREELGLTQRALARKVGRTETSISKIELGQQRIDLVELLDVCRALRVDLGTIASTFEQEARM